MTMQATSEKVRHIQFTKEQLGVAPDETVTEASVGRLVLTDLTIETVAIRIERKES